MCKGSVLLQAGVRVGGGGWGERGGGRYPVCSTHNMKRITFLPPHTRTRARTHTHTSARKDINAFAFSPLNLSNPLIFRIIKYAKVTEVNR